MVLKLHFPRFQNDTILMFSSLLPLLRRVPVAPVLRFLSGQPPFEGDENTKIKLSLGTIMKVKGMISTPIAELEQVTKVGLQYKFWDAMTKFQLLKATIISKITGQTLM